MLIHQILLSDAPNLDSLLPSAVHSVKHVFSASGHRHKVWFDHDIIDLISKNFNEDVLRAYRNLKPYAYKADLARYCILSVHGGIYIDINIEMVAVPPTDGYDLVVIRDYNNGTRCAPWQIANGLIYARAHHPVFDIAINKIVEHCKTKYYGKRTLSPTGPELFGLSIAQYGWDNERSSYLVGDFVDGEPNRKKFIIDGRTIALHKELNGGELGIPGTNSYVTLWHEQNIYNEGF